MNPRNLIAVLVIASVAPPAGSQQTRAPVLVTTDWLSRQLRDSSIIVIHAGQSRGDYDAGHVPGSRFLPWAAYTAQRDSLNTELPAEAALDSALESIGVSSGSRIVISGGPLPNTARLYFTLDYFGLGDRTSLLDGGIEAWREEGRPVETTSPGVARGNLTLSKSPARMVDAAWIVGRTAAPDSKVAVVDARAPEFFAGTSQGNMPRAGRLPMAGSLPFNWTTGELGKYRDLPSLERLFRNAGAEKGDTVVTYCHVGMQASVVFLAARIAGFEAAVYDGSFEEWSRKRELPVGTGVPPQR